jgi:hypothetical protein
VISGSVDALVRALLSQGAGARALRDVIEFGYETAEVPVDVPGMCAGAEVTTGCMEVVADGSWWCDGPAGAIGGG